MTKTSWPAPKMAAAAVTAAAAAALFLAAAPRPAAAQATFLAKVNFQPAAAPVPSGYVADTGAAYAARGNGLTYGWNAANGNTRDRDSSLSLDQRYDTLNHLQNGGTYSWEIAVPNGEYDVTVVAGDAGFTNSVYRINVENTLVVNGTPTSAARWVSGTATVSVTDGRLTLSNGAGASNNKVCFIDIAQKATGTGNGPTDNPVAGFYGTRAYPWAADLAWGRVFNVLDYGGNGNGSVDNLAAYNAARDAAAAAGGGVVYFPAGTYYFSDNLVLKNGVVLRGQAPANTNAKTDTFDPPSNLVFPAYVPSLSGSGTPNSTAFKKIVAESPQTDSNLGLVWLDVNRAGIKLTGDGLTNTNQNILVFGVRTNNVAEPDAGVPQLTHTYTSNGASVTVPFQKEWQRWSNRFAANVKIQAYANVLVANSRHNDAITDNFEQPGFNVRDNNTVLALNNPGQAVFNYTNHYGIEVNRSKSGGYSLAGTPATEPSLFRPGIVVRDNWVFHTMRIGITASGEGLIIQDNVVRDQDGKVAWVDPTGKRLVQNAATLENRIIDWSGYNVVIKGNDGRVYRHLLKTGPYLSVDGEGILLQECCGGSLVNGVLIENNTVNSYIGLYKTRDINNATIRGNTLLASGDTFGIYVSANTNGGTYTANNVLIENNSVAAGNISLLASGGAGSGNVIRNNTCAGGSGSISHSCAANASISGNTGFPVNPCN